MYVRHLKVSNVKLLRDVDISFEGEDGRPRMWTVFVGENRLCKTTLLQTIAAAACGPDRGTQLVTDVVASWPDLRDPRLIRVEALFGFSALRHADREYPLLDRSEEVPKLWSLTELEPEKRVLGGGSGYVGTSGGDGDPLTVARMNALPEWFVAGYGPSRLLRGAGMAARQSEPTIDRMRSLFGHELIGTGFIDLLGEDLGRAFAKVLQSVFIAGGLLPHVTALELRGRGGIRSTRDLVEAQRFEMTLGEGNTPIRIPAAWLSQGYQTLIAWLADVVGQILLEAGEPVEAADMEGTVLMMRSRCWCQIRYVDAIISSWSVPGHKEGRHRLTGARKPAPAKGPTMVGAEGLDEVGADGRAGVGGLWHEEIRAGRAASAAMRVKVSGTLGSWAQGG